MARFGVLRLRASPNSNKRPETRGVRAFDKLISYTGKSYFSSLATGKVKPELCPYSSCDFVTV